MIKPPPLKLADFDRIETMLEDAAIKPVYGWYGFCVADTITPGLVVVSRMGTVPVVAIKGGE